MRYHLLAALAILTVTGCSTNLQSNRMYADSEVEPGVLYNLPMAVFDVDVKFLVTDCRVKGGTHELTWELAEGAAVHSLAPDPAETYRIPYNTLNSPLKLTSMTLSMHPNGMIKSINAAAEDRTSQVLASVAGTAINLFKTSVLRFTGTSATRTGMPCADFIDKRLKQRKSILDIELPAARLADKALAADKKASDEIRVLVEQLKAKLAESLKGTDAAATAALKTELAKAQAQASVAAAKLKDRSPVMELDAQIEQEKIALALAKKKGDSAAAKASQDKIDGLEASRTVASATLKDREPATAELQATLVTLTEALTYPVRKTNWQPRNDAATRCVAVSAPHVDFLARLARASNATIPDTSVDEEFVAHACIEAAGHPVKPVATGTTPAAPGSSSTIFTGVVYRQPVSGTVSVTDRRPGGTRFTSPSAVSLPQLGAKALVWLENRTFDKNSIVVSFNEDGSMSQLTFQAEARAERGAAAVQDLSKSLVDLLKLRSDAIKAKEQAVDDEQKKAQQAQLDALDQQIALINKRKDVEAARTPPDPLDKEKDQLKKLIDVETLRQQLDALKKKAE
ncbi:hypothetical protein [Variovorax sp. PCZ-1]|uniref:hypothetical protein n=1 Tax=Variovorax sp. PCZ-1 TaxID=2835533 RepID=UPI001BCDBBA8|nr:hypothetical protein [Variovorax sp. PCZ-1]MBS7807744.1 hypothetical protein [Variovorax sp. PCZ-1]